MDSPSNRAPSRSPAPTANESAEWHAHYADTAASERRRRQIGKKLARLGVAGNPENATMLDVGCGHGETLAALHDLGIRGLHGIDLTVQAAVAADPRFQVKAGDAARLDYPDASFDWVFCIHSLHHLATPEKVRQFLQEAHRVLKPGGRLSIIDFPASLQIKVAFWFFRRGFFLVTPYLRWFGRIIQEEWCFLEGYLSRWPEVRRGLLAEPFRVERHHRRFFYYYLTLRKPVSRP